MSLSRLEVQDLYTKNIQRYASFVNLFQSSSGISALLQRSNLLREGLRFLDAGCGFGMATFALVDALQEKNLHYTSIDAFDLTPAMLARFQKELNARRLSRVQLEQADVLALDSLPPSWTNYDVIISTSMLEYLPKQDLPRALAGLRARLSSKGHILVMITRRTLETKLFIEWGWHAERYTRDELLQAFAKAGFQTPEFQRFPSRYFWLNRANWVALASAY